MLNIDRRRFAPPWRAVRAFEYAPGFNNGGKRGGGRLVGKDLRLMQTPSGGARVVLPSSRSQGLAGPFVRHSKLIFAFASLNHCVLRFTATTGDHRHEYPSARN